MAGMTRARRLDKLLRDLQAETATWAENEIEYMAVDGEMVRTKYYWLMLDLVHMAVHGILGAHVDAAAAAEYMRMRPRSVPVPHPDAYDGITRALEAKSAQVTLLATIRKAIAGGEDDGDTDTDQAQGQGTAATGGDAGGSTPAAAAAAPAAVHADGDSQDVDEG